MAELVKAVDSSPTGAIRVSSSLTVDTIFWIFADHFLENNFFALAEEQCQAK
jgi:hypothetical protein